MDKFNTYFGQVVTDQELDSIFASLGQAIEQFIQDFGYAGIAAGADLAPNSTPNLSVQVSAPGVVYDQTGNRIAFATPIVVNVAVDENNQSTAVIGGSSNAKWVSVFIRFKRVDTDPRIDDTGATVFFRSVAAYDVIVTQASEASASVAIRPALRGDAILLGDIRLTPNKTTITAGDIDLSRRQTIYNIPGTPLSIQAKNLQQAIAQLLSTVNSFGPNTILIPALNGTPVSISAGTLMSVLSALLAAINQRAAIIDNFETTGIARLSAKQRFTNENTFGIVHHTGPIDDGHDTDPTIGKWTDPTVPMIGSGITASELGNTKWRLMFNFKWTGGQYVRFYTGSTAAGMAFVICTNAIFRPSSNDWRLQNNAQPAAALIWQYGRIHVSTEAPQPGETANPQFSEWKINTPAGLATDARGLNIYDALSVFGISRFGGDVDMQKLTVAGVATFTQPLKASGFETTGSDGYVAADGDNSFIRTKGNVRTTNGSLIAENQGTVQAYGATIKGGGITAQGGDVLLTNGANLSLGVTSNSRIRYSTARVRTRELLDIVTASPNLSWSIGSGDANDDQANPTSASLALVVGTIANNAKVTIYIPIPYEPGNTVQQLQWYSFHPQSEPIQAAFVSQYKPGDSFTSGIGGYNEIVVSNIATRASQTRWDTLDIPAADQTLVRGNRYYLRLRTGSSGTRLFNAAASWTQLGIGPQD